MAHRADFDENVLNYFYHPSAWEHPQSSPTVLKTNGKCLSIARETMKSNKFRIN